MFNFLVSASLKNRLFVLAAAMMLVAYGLYVLPRVPVDVFPDLNRRRDIEAVGFEPAAR